MPGNGDRRCSAGTPCRPASWSRDRRPRSEAQHLGIEALRAFQIRNEDDGVADFTDGEGYAHGLASCRHSTARGRGMARAHRLSASAAVQRMADKRLKARELVEACLDRIEA